ncbi:FAD-dependent monooxygenase [Planomonospora venezuelensis]|uniref:2-polyprenyl-6-methoxyphenol hydroxylase-like FAD-dependent oxidoreductase n=1 Tax=Planomonospora venezuelensis TaxID=1999 RepID=A0A841DAF7_PLAVE|nr:FAD-dependent monooxygenase [Planomonospora venezuelensis]MBB5965667.1 2-polyprenyl-6-methoxyphenol hydroxylase-like FAD-dependent oxidoreductase [Planomonospora venezuelensis]GIN02509.1 FAD-dependent oxidoreductase [Planomonospora venezuelensis]
MQNKSILISGASIAGPALAHWLHRYGFAVTVVERAPALREGGQAVDFRGAAHMGMLRRMGVLEDIRRLRTAPGPLTVVDGAGTPLASLPPEFTGGEVEILRGDLSRLLYERTRDDAEYVFGDSIASMTETAGGVDVVFDSGARRTFDLVIGADGLHSNVRRLAFGPEGEFVHPSGYYVAIFTMDGDPGTGPGTLLYNEPGRSASVGGVHGRTDAGFVFTTPEPLDYDHRDTARQKELVAAVCEGMGWRTAQLLDGMRKADDFYFDSISLVRMDRCTAGRVALLGDAGYGATCGGMGAGMAMISSYVLAGELADAGGDHRVAFPRYEEAIRGYAKACQKVAAGMGPFIAPPTEKKIRSRNRAYKVLSSRILSVLLNRMTTKAANSITLKEYGSARSTSGSLR